MTADSSSPMSSIKTGGGIGDGLIHFSNDRKSYIYWNNANELVDRLRLLIASHKAGNSNHLNEVISIIKELKEANIIE